MIFVTYVRKTTKITYFINPIKDSGIFILLWAYKTVEPAQFREGLSIKVVI
ncbi:hypothetical protein HanIR_Chr16g0842121 [Helianthus annuus]|nr:hypothetical protein HanIR_Chr16g0842121 [Helianthus annuus]